MRNSDKMGRAGNTIKAREKQSMQPKPFTPGITKRMVRDHATRLYRDRSPERPLSLKDWTLAERDLVQGLEAEIV